jgi:hypothetical protein
MNTPTTQEAKEMIQWLFSTETQYDETFEAAKRRNEVTAALVQWAKNSIDTKTANHYNTTMTTNELVRHIFFKLDEEENGYNVPKMQRFEDGIVCVFGKKVLTISVSDITDAYKPDAFKQ